MSKEDKPKSRWNAGNERYPPKTELDKYRPWDGWRNGARLAGTRPCTCHPDDRKGRRCQQKYAVKHCFPPKGRA